MDFQRILDRSKIENIGDKKIPNIFQLNSQFFDKEHTITLKITSFKDAFDFRAHHYYGRISLGYPSYLEMELTRPLTENEIKKYPDRFYFYKAGDLVNAWNSIGDLINFAKLVFKYRFERGFIFNIEYPDGTIKRAN